MDTIKKGTEILTTTSTKTEKLISLIIPYICILIIGYLVINMISARMDYSIFIDWWNNNGGQTYNKTFDIYSMAYFSHSQLLFDIRQKLQPGTVNLNYTDIMLLQSIIINNSKTRIPPKGTTLPNNFVTPQHICQGIAWSDNDIDIFREGIDSYYNGAWWYPAWVSNGKPGPDNGIQWTKICKYEVTGFWPHQNGLYGFFDILKPSSFNKEYDLTDNIATSSILDTKSVQGVYYSPGNTGRQGSWAQLFADFGVVYSQRQGSATTTKVPVLHSSSKTNLWYTSGYKNGKYGPNFMGIYKINPSSYMLTSWISNYYNDPTTGQKFDAQAFRNLIGMEPGVLKATQGGWIKFFKGINTELSSYNEIMNELFATYATNYTAIYHPPSCNKLKIAMEALATAAMLAIMIAAAPVTGGASLVVGAACVVAVGAQIASQASTC
jgi:hypothetical protein